MEVIFRREVSARSPSADTTATTGVLLYTEMPGAMERRMGFPVLSWKGLM
tara:strand:+ start:767 stop:916 length:150 start_codon:yes stop_codon:yes gene_type:complete